MFYSLFHETNHNIFQLFCLKFDLLLHDNCHFYSNEMVFVKEKSEIEPKLWQIDFVIFPRYLC